VIRLIFVKNEANKLEVLKILKEAL